MAVNNRAQETVCADKKERRSNIKSAVPPLAQQSTRPCRHMHLLRRTLLSDRSRHHSRNIILLAFARCCVLRSVLQSQRAFRWAERRSSPARR